MLVGATSVYRVHASDLLRAAFLHTLVPMQLPRPRASGAVVQASASLYEVYGAYIVTLQVMGVGSATLVRATTLPTGAYDAVPAVSVP